MTETTTTALSRIESEEYHVESHDVPFGPLLGDGDVQNHLNVDGWEYNGYINQTEANLEKYELTDDGWVHTGEETVDIDDHRLNWQGTHSVPGYDGKQNVLVTLEYGESVIHTDSNGEPTSMSPGYILAVQIFSMDGDIKGEIPSETFRHLGDALKDTVAILMYLQDGVIPEGVTAPTKNEVESLIGDITGEQPDL